MEETVPGQLSTGAPEAPLFLMDCETTNSQRPAPSPPPLPPTTEGGTAPEEADGPLAVDVIPVHCSCSCSRTVKARNGTGWGLGGRQD